MHIYLQTRTRYRNNYPTSHTSGGLNTGSKRSNPPHLLPRTVRTARGNWDTIVSSFRLKNCPRGKRRAARASLKVLKYRVGYAWPPRACNRAVYLSYTRERLRLCRYLSAREMRYFLRARTRVRVTYVLSGWLFIIAPYGVFRWVMDGLGE